jgi:hypothetical protein
MRNSASVRVADLLRANGFGSFLGCVRSAMPDRYQVRRSTRQKVN